MKKTLQILFLILTLVLPSFVSAEVPAKPAFSGYVYDYANVISASDEYLMNLYGQTVDSLEIAQVVAITVESLSGIDAADFSTQLINSWGIGRVSANDGVVLLLAPNERRIQIGTGSGIDNQLSAETCGLLLDQFAIPSLSVNDFSDGMVSLMKATCAKLLLEKHPIFDDRDMINKLLSD